ncbi:MAG: hypothetical protein ABI655_13595 [Phenylobacterium sp.]
MQLFMIPPWVNVAAVVSATSLVLWKGGWRERTLAAMILLAFLPSYGLEFLGDCRGWPPWNMPVGFYWAVDIVELATCVAFALSSNRYWAIWASSLNLLGPATRIVRSLVPSVSHWAYLSAQIIWFYLLLAVLLGGVWEARRARRGAPSEARRARRGAPSEG